MTKAKTIGTGWHKESLRHSQARKYGRASPRIQKLLKAHPEYKNMTFEQLYHKGIFLRYHKDSDKDGTENIHDCKPLNPKKQDSYGWYWDY